MTHNGDPEIQPTILDASREEGRSPGELSGKKYVKPTVLTHSGEDVLDELGPAQACYPFSSCGSMP